MQEIRRFDDDIFRAGSWRMAWWMVLGACVPLLEAEGHFVTAPTLTGLAERAPARSRDVNLTTHINDIVEQNENPIYAAFRRLETCLSDHCRACGGTQAGAISR